LISNLKSLNTVESVDLPSRMISDQLFIPASAAIISHKIQARKLKPSGLASTADNNDLGPVTLSQ
jgi:hypothetical protein